MILNMFKTNVAESCHTRSRVRSYIKQVEMLYVHVTYNVHAVWKQHGEVFMVKAQQSREITRVILVPLLPRSLYVHGVQQACYKHGMIGNCLPTFQVCVKW